jgi:Fic family protein
MNISKFKSGIWEQKLQYKSFRPNSVNLDWTVDDGSLNKVLSEANIRLGELNAFSMLVPDVDFFIKMHVEKEATKSSKIEGTQTNMEDALQKKENIDPEKRDDWVEVRNYVMAMNRSIEDLDKLPLSNRLLRQAHDLLMRKARGEHKTPGKFRISQNWIGGSSITDAVFIPPHQELVEELMSDLEKFLHNENISTPDLIKIGIAHYQFETIHPFLDGNGRIGRLLITLYLVHQKRLVKPTLYLSDFFEKNKTLYYDNLMRTRTHNNLNQWLKFFLEGVKQTSESSIQTFQNIIELRNRLEKNAIMTLGKKAKIAHELLNYLYTQPVVEAGDVAVALEINISTALRLIDDFVRLKILVEMTGYKRNRVFGFKKYISLFV